MLGDRCVLYRSRRVSLSASRALYRDGASLSTGTHRTRCREWSRRDTWWHRHAHLTGSRFCRLGSDCIVGRGLSRQSACRVARLAWCKSSFLDLMAAASASATIHLGRVSRSFGARVCTKMKEEPNQSRQPRTCLSCLVLAHESRQARSWLICNVRFFRGLSRPLRLKSISSSSGVGIRVNAIRIGALSFTHGRFADLITHASNPQTRSEPRNALPP